MAPTQRARIVAALACLAASPAAAQRPWRAALGIEGGFAYLKPAGTGAADQVELWDAPGQDFALDQGAVFVTIPVAGRLALEPAVTAAHDIPTVVGNLSHWDAGVRALYALAGPIYGAVGGVIVHTTIGGTGGTQAGLEVALGARSALSRALDGRIEVRAVATRKSSVLAPEDIYSARLGLAAPLVINRLTATARPYGPWRPAIGVAGGYVRTRFVGRSTVTALAVPALGAGVGLLSGAPGASPPGVFAIMPLAGPLAFEPTADVHRLSTAGAALTTAAVFGRLDVAVISGWYVAAGGGASVVAATGSNTITVPGAVVASGWRFTPPGRVGWRAEVNYTMLRRSKDLGYASNALGILMGALLPLR